MAERPIRVVLAKLGLDGHDRGVRVVASALRDAGMEVIYTGLWQSPEHVARTALHEDADAIGVSVLSGAHLTLIPALLAALRTEEIPGVPGVPVVVGGIIPPEDAVKLRELGAADVLGPGASLEEIVQCFRAAARGKATQTL